MVFWAYMLRCADGRYYTGHTDNLEQRIGQHRARLCNYTSTRLPVKLVWSETFETRAEAITVELMVGGWSRAKKEALIAGDWKRVSHFAKPLKERPVLDHGFSTSLETNGESSTSPPPPPFASSEVEKADTPDRQPECP